MYQIVAGAVHDATRRVEKACSYQSYPCLEMTERTCPSALKGQICLFNEGSLPTTLLCYIDKAQSMIRVIRTA